MSYDGGGKPGMGSGARAMSLNGMPFAVTRAAKRVACNASQQGVGIGETIATNLCKIIWTRSSTNVLLGRLRRQGVSRTALIA